MMKFSYRVIAVISLLVTLTIMFFLFGDNLLRAKTRMQRHDIISSEVHTSNWHTQSRAVVSHSKEAQAQVQGDGSCQLADRLLPTDGLSTYDLFNKMKLTYQGNALLAMKTNRDDKDIVYKDKLTVILMPHSHNDPGWLQTIGQYYLLQTRPILQNIMAKLEQYPNMTFIWAETVFLSMWWDELDQSEKIRVKNLITRGQLEIVNGGWVAPDEASTHYFAIIDQLIEGHQWLEKNLGVKPKISWSPDPFGYSSTMPYILNRAGVKDMVILRIHDEVKAELRQNQNLEFHWRQYWDKSNGETDAFCHLLPYVLYSIKHSCGPNPYICLLFDFRKIPGEYGEGNPPILTNDNIEKYSKYLLDEFRAKAEHFRHNIILYPLGDDFRFDREIEWDQQYVNYNKLFNYMNSRKDWNIDAKFGTLKDYFSAVKKVEKAGKLKGGKFPTLYGGFYPYMDRDEEYWTGYFTTRPFYKQLEREIESNLRSAEILNSLAMAYQSNYKKPFRHGSGNLKRLTTARRSLALFQHHDAITGTSKPQTVADYEVKLWDAKASTKKVTVTAAQYLFLKDLQEPADGKPENKYFINVDDARSSDQIHPEKKLVTVTPDGTKVVIFNPVGKHRFELLQFRVSSPVIKVTDSKGDTVPSQINPIWVGSSDVSIIDYELIFYTDLPPLAMKVFILTDIPEKVKARVAGVAITATLFSNPFRGQAAKDKSIFNVRRLDTSPHSRIVFENHHIRAKFNHRGLLLSVTTLDDNHVIDIALSFMMYNSRGSGAYIFMPQSSATSGSGSFSRDPEVSVLRGPLVSEVRVKYYALQHVVRILHTEKPLGAALQVENNIDLTTDHEWMDKEIIMKFTTSVKNGQIWYSDLNGFQTVRHKSHKKYYIAGNYQPMSAMAYIEGNDTRFSILSAQSHGVSSLKTGCLEVMLDRKLSSDDNRGLGEGVYDSKKTLSQFALLLERPQSSLPRVSEETKPSYPSLLSLLISDQLRHPVTNFIVYRNPENFVNTFSPLASSLPCDVDIVNMKTMESKNITSAANVVLILHRKGFQCGFRTYDLECKLTNGVVEANFLRDVEIKDMTEMTLSLMYEKRLSVRGEIKLDQMEIATYKMNFV
ncbi:alpha-mannosidase 2x-like [Lineus longissimus]|uniref:alpha-mannosidase 2x-like n=1 Tax=Lineus longissimus TaxID=88925 RepID=UPI00315C692B